MFISAILSNRIGIDRIAKLTGPASWQSANPTILRSSLTSWTHLYMSYLGEFLPFFKRLIIDKYQVRRKMKRSLP